MRRDDSDRIAALMRRVAALETMVLRFSSIQPMPMVMPVSMTQVGGDDGDEETMASWTYDVFDLYEQNVFTGLDIEDSGEPSGYQAMHAWRRPNLGSVTPATYGLVYRTPPNTGGAATWGPWGLLWCNEVSEFEACAAPEA